MIQSLTSKKRWSRVSLSDVNFWLFWVLVVIFDISFFLNFSKICIQLS